MEPNTDGIPPVENFIVEVQKMKLIRQKKI